MFEITKINTVNHNDKKTSNKKTIFNMMSESNTL